MTTCLNCQYWGGNRKVANESTFSVCRRAKQTGSKMRQGGNCVFMTASNFSCSEFKDFVEFPQADTSIIVKEKED